MHSKHTKGQREESDSDDSDSENKTTKRVTFKKESLTNQLVSTLDFLQGHKDFSKSGRQFSMSFPAITSVLDHNSAIPSIEKHDKEVRKQTNLEYEVELKRRGMVRKLRPDIDRSKNDVYKDSEIVNHSISSLKQQHGKTVG